MTGPGEISKRLVVKMLAWSLNAKAFTPDFRMGEHGAPAIRMLRWQLLSHWWVILTGLQCQIAVCKSPDLSGMQVLGAAVPLSVRDVNSFEKSTAFPWVLNYRLRDVTALGLAL